MTPQQIALVQRSFEKVLPIKEAAAEMFWAAGERRAMPNDSGPIYLETAMGRFPVEPWNTYSNLLFLALIVFWFLRVRRNIRDHLFIAYCLPVFLLGWVGGTVYHATRSHEVWLFLDWAPIALLALAVAIFFWHRQGFNGFSRRFSWSPPWRSPASRSRCWAGQRPSGPGWRWSPLLS